MDRFTLLHHWFVSFSSVICLIDVDCYCVQTFADMVRQAGGVTHLLPLIARTTHPDTLYKVFVHFVLSTRDSVCMFDVCARVCLCVI